MTTSHSFADFYKNLHEAKGIETIDTPEVITPVLAPHPFFDGEPTKEAGLPALTPIMDTIDGWSSIDWTRVRDQLRAGVNNVGIALAVVSEKTHELGIWLAKV